MKRQFRLRIQRIKRRLRHFVFHSILHADDPPHRLALGIALGMFTMVTPTVGFQMLIVVFLAWLFRANKVVGLPIVWITNPATIIPIFFSCYRLGQAILGRPEVGLEWWARMSNRPEDWWPRVQFYWDRFMEIAVPLWLGSMIVALVLGYVSYYVSYYAIAGYRMRRWGQLMPPPKLLRKPRIPLPRRRAAQAKTSNGS
jgi:uncharacterized protein (DUF2062 family)